MPTDSAVDADIVVVGGGPVGMLLAGELALHGIRPLVLERLATPTGESKAGTLHARTAQSLDRRGLLEAVQPGMFIARPPVARAPLHIAGMFDHDIAPVVSEGPALVGSPQAYAEQVFAQRAVDLGARIERDSEVVGLAEHETHVTLEVSDGRGDIRQVTARWVIGCDGARSAVRKHAGIPFVGTPATVSALMGEVQLLSPETAPAGWERNRRGWTLVWANPVGYSRVCTYDFRGPAPDRSAPVTFEELRGEVERIAGRPVPMRSPRWLTRFSDAALQAAHYRSGRVLLAGDAAHVHFPMGGQGLNLGLQDAINLGWKLAAHVQGWAPKSLIDTYHDERHPVAERVLANVRAQVALMNPGQLTDSLRELFADLMHLPQVNDFLAGMISGTSVRYDMNAPDDPLAGEFAPDLALKTRTSETRLARLLHDGRPVMLDLVDSAELREVAGFWSDRVDIVTAVTDQLTDTPAMLVRPDGYIAWSGTGAKSDARTLTTALRTWFGEPCRS